MWAGADAERKKYETALSALSEYLNLLKQDRKLFKLTLTGEDEPFDTAIAYFEVLKFVF